MALDQVIGHLKILLLFCYFFMHRYVHIFLDLDRVISHLKIIFYHLQPYMYSTHKRLRPQSIKNISHLLSGFCTKYKFCWKTGPGLCCVLHQAGPILKSFVKCIDCKLYHGCIVRERPFYTSEWIDFGSGKIVGEMSWNVLWNIVGAF